MKPDYKQCREIWIKMEANFRKGEASCLEMLRHPQAQGPELARIAQHYRNISHSMMATKHKLTEVFGNRNSCLTPPWETFNVRK